MTTKTHPPHATKAPRAVTETATPPEIEPVAQVPIWELSPAEVNDAIYKPVRADDPSVRELAKSIGDHGVLDPLLVSADWVIISGHRRHAAARLAGLDAVPVIRLLDVHSTSSDFVAKLVEANRSRDKTAGERVREAVAVADPARSHAALVRHRHAARRAGQEQAARAGLAVVAATPAAKRHRISAAKRPMLDALKKIIADNEEFWPITLRQCHYRMLNVGLLRNARRPNSRYINDAKSYKDLSGVFTRARLAGEVEWHTVTDPTRPASVWTKFRNATPFVADRIKRMFAGYYRDLLQSQDFYLEVVAEKLTVETQVDRACEEFTATYSVGRGYSSVDFRYQLAERFRKSGKPYMKLLVVADFDPEGEDICRSLTASMADEFGVDVQAYKVALTADQVREFNLGPFGQAVKADSSRAPQFVAKHGNKAYECEALEPAVLQGLVKSAVQAVIDRGRYDAEVAAEATDAATIDAQEARVRRALAESD